MVSTQKLVDALGIPPELALGFFVAFSRFEYGLKVVGFVNHRYGTAEADWQCFFTFLEQLEPSEIQPVIAVGQRLIDEPPKKLVLDGDGNGDPWKRVTRGRQSTIRFLLEAVKRARNNLFHGGKWLTNPDTPARNYVVVSTALAVIERLLLMPSLERVRSAFDEL